MVGLHRSRVRVTSQLSAIVVPLLSLPTPGCYLGDVRPLHVRLSRHRLGPAEVESLRASLERAGHFLSEPSGPTLPAGFSSVPDLELTDPDVTGSSAPGDPLELVEARHIAATLEHTGGNRRQAALLLGVARSTLLAKIRRYKL